MSLRAGQQLRKLREQLGLSLREVESASSALAERYRNPEFYLPFSRLSEIETKGIVPTIFRIYSLAAIYAHDYRQICAWYGVDWNLLAAELAALPRAKTSRLSAPNDATVVAIPELDPAF